MPSPAFLSAVAAAVVVALSLPRSRASSMYFVGNSYTQFNNGVPDMLARLGSVRGAAARGRAKQLRAAAATTSAPPQVRRHRTYPPPC